MLNPGDSGKVHLGSCESKTARKPCGSRQLASIRGLAPAAPLHDVGAGRQVASPRALTAGGRRGSLPTPSFSLPCRDHASTGVRTRRRLGVAGRSPMPHMYRRQRNREQTAWRVPREELERPLWDRLPRSAFAISLPRLSRKLPAGAPCTSQTIHTECRGPSNGG